MELTKTEQYLIAISYLLCDRSYKEKVSSIYDATFDVQGIWEFRHNTLNIAFRGSTSFQDWINNFKFNKLEYPWGTGDTGKVVLHQGFTDAYKSVRSQIHSLIDFFGQDCAVNFTGHSQGGAIALIAAVDCQYNFGISPNLVTFGQPKVGNLGFGWSANRRLKSFLRVVNRRDPVPLLPADGRGLGLRPDKRLVQEGNRGYCHCGQEIKFSKLALIPHHLAVYGEIIDKI
ncbi:MAG: lipase family protein [Chroococcidiopsis sp.]